MHWLSENSIQGLSLGTKSLFVHYFWPNSLTSLCVGNYKEELELEFPKLQHFQKGIHFCVNFGGLDKKRLKVCSFGHWIYLCGPGILSIHSALRVRALASQPQEMESGLLVVFLQSRPNEDPFMHAEMLTEIGNMEVGNWVWPKCLKH